MDKVFYTMYKFNIMCWNYYDINFLSYEYIRSVLLWQRTQSYEMTASFDIASTGILYNDLLSIIFKLIFFSQIQNVSLPLRGGLKFDTQYRNTRNIKTIIVAWMISIINLQLLFFFFWLHFYRSRIFVIVLSL